MYNIRGISIETEHEKQSRKNWNYRDNIATYFLLWLTDDTGFNRTNRARYGTFSYFAPLARAMAIRVFWTDAGFIMVADSA